MLSGEEEIRKELPCSGIAVQPQLFHVVQEDLGNKEGREEMGGLGGGDMDGITQLHDWQLCSCQATNDTNN